MLSHADFVISNLNDEEDDRVEFILEEHHSI
jgi:hypothetical protein